MRLRWLAIPTTVLATGCSSLPRQPPGVPPAPETITREEPGGDAHDPHLAALARLNEKPWGFRIDRQEALRIPMPDWENWRRVKFFGMPTFAAFRYGDAHHAVIAAWLRKVEPGQVDDLEACLDRFERWGEPTARTFGVKMDRPVTTRARWAKGDVVIRSLDAKLDTLFSKKSYAAAYAAYRIWPGTCTVIGVAVASRDSEREARQVRDRYAREGFRRVVQIMAETPKP